MMTMKKQKINHEMNECNNVNEINACEGATSMSKELHDAMNANTIAKNNFDHKYECDTPFKEKYKAVLQKIVIQKNKTNNQHNLLSTLAVMVMAFMKIMMIKMIKPFKAYEEMYWKKALAYDDVKHEASYNGNKLQHTQLKMTKVILWLKFTHSIFIGLIRLLTHSVKEKYNSQRSCDTR